MAKIEIEKKPRRSLVPLLLALVVIAAVAVGIYYYMEGQRAAPPPAETSPVTPGSLNDATSPDNPLQALPGAWTLLVREAEAGAVTLARRT